MRLSTLFRPLAPWLAIGLIATTNVSATLADDDGSQLLVTVGERGITAADLQRLVNSSPIATQFNTLEADQQAAIRGRMLKNLIYSELLYQEALARGVDQRPEIQAEVEAYRRNLLYQRYLLSLRGLMKASPRAGAIATRLEGEPDALAAARAADTARRFEEVKRERTLALGSADHLRVYLAPLAADPRDPRAVVAQGDHTRVLLGDLVYTGERLEELEQEALRRRLDGAVEQQLMSRAGEALGLDLSAPLAAYRRDLIRQTLMQEKEQAWIPDRATLEAYYEAHPELSRVAERWHVGQLVVATREEAEALRERILAGESLFRLAAEKSIDPYGRQEAGDMGWVRPDEAPPALREALEGLPIDQVSPVIETPRGFHLAVVMERRPGYRKPLRAVAAGIRRSLILERIAEDYTRLSQRYPIQWHLRAHRAEGAR